MELFKMIVGSLLRQGTAVLGAWLVSKGYIDADQAASLGEYIIGGGLIVASIVASVFFKKKALDTQPPLK